MVRIGSLSEAGVSSIEEALGFGLGVALAEALAPLATELAQKAWSVDPSRAIDAGTAAEVVAEDVEQIEWGAAEARQHGIDAERFAAIVGEVLNAPGLAELLTMLRRGTIDPDDFVHGLRKAKMETRWDQPLTDLRTVRLDPAVIATSIQRGIIEDPGLLPVGPPTAAGRVPPMPVVQIDALHEAQASGFDRERLAAITRIVGLPPAPGELLQLVNRGEIGETDYLRGIAEGNTRNEWAAFLLKLRRRLLTPHEYVELRLRAWITDAQMHAGAALSGLEPADADLLHKMMGRPLSFHQVFIGLRRHGAYGEATDGIDPAFLKSLQESNIRPEWYGLAWAQRFTYPSPFVLRRLAADGVIDRDRLHEIFLQLGWEPTLAASAADAYAVKTGTKADPAVVKAENQLWTALHKAYVQEEADEAAAADNLTAIDVPPEAQAHVISLWNRERALTRKVLTPSQIRKVYRDAKLTHDEALERLERQGYTPDDAEKFLTG